MKIIGAIALFFAVTVSPHAATIQHQTTVKPEVVSTDVVPQANSVLSPAAGSTPASGAMGVAVSTPLNSMDPQKIVILPTTKDDQRTQKTLTSLVKQTGWFPQVQITVLEGMVTIKGNAKNAAQIEWLAKTADRLPGVIAVINQTQIESLPISDLSPAWEELSRLVNEAKKALPLTVLALLMAAVFALINRYISRFSRTVWERHISNPFLLQTASRLTMIPVWAIFFFLILKTAGLSGLATTIIGGTGAASLVLGFAFKGIAENYLSGLLLAIRSPFTKGDEIQVQQYSGFVQSLNMRGTTIIDYDGNVVLIPNSIVIQSVIRNRTTNTSTRNTFNLTISFTDSIGKAQEIIAAAFKSIPEILAKPAASVTVDKLSSSGIDLTISFWFDSSKSSGDKIKSALVGRIKDELLAQGLHIPDSAREVIFADALKVQMIESEADADATEQKKVAHVQAQALAQLKSEPPTAAADNDCETQDIRDLAEDATILRKTIHTDLLRT